MAEDPNQQKPAEGRDDPGPPLKLDSNLQVRGNVAVSPDFAGGVEPNYSIFRFLPRQTFNGTVASHDSIIDRNTFVQTVDKIFGENLKYALGLKDERAQVEALLAFGEKPLIPRQILQIAQELSLRGADTEMTQFLDAQKKASAANNTAAFFESPEVKQWQATALQRAGRNEEALRLSREILKDDPKNSEALRTATMARVAAAGDNRSAALAEFAQGFAETGNYSLGMGALNGALETGDIARAKQLAPLVALAAENVGGDQSKSFWPAVVIAQAATISGDVKESQRAMLHLVEVLGATNENGTSVVSNADKNVALDRIKRILDAQPGSAEVKALLEPVAERLEMSLGKRPMEALPYQEQASVEKTFRERGYTSRQGMTPEGFHIRGNVRVGNMLSDSSTTLRDKMQFLEVAKTPLDKFIEAGLIRREDLPAGLDTTKSLSGIDDVETRIRASQQVARGIFDVDGRNLENLHGLDHKIYDSVVRLRIDHSGATTLRHLSEEAQTAFLDLKKDEALFKAVKSGDVTPAQREALLSLSPSPEFQRDPVASAQKLIADAELFRTSDTRTNIAVAAEQGIGDCRHVAAAAEALVSAVQQDRTGDYIRQATESLARGDREGYQRFTEAASKEINGYEMRVYDQAVTAAVETSGVYNPVLTADGKFVAAADSKPQLIETHMHNVVRMTGDNGEARYIVADSFYQKGQYRMGWVENAAPETFLDPGKNMDKLRLSGGEVEAVVCERDENGKLRMKDGHPIPVVDTATGRLVTVKLPLVLESTEYSSPSRIQIGTPTPEDRLNGRSREPDAGVRLTESLQSQQRQADYVVQAEFVVEHPDKVNAPELNESGDRQAARQRIAELKGATPAVAAPKTPARPEESARPEPRQGAAHTDYVAGVSAGYTAFVQTKVAIDSAQKLKEDIARGDTTRAVIDGSNATVNASSALVGATQLVAEHSKDIADLARKARLGPTGEILGVAADLTNAVEAYASGTNTDEATERARSSLTQAAVTRAAIAIGGIGATGFLTAAENSGENYTTRAEAKAAMDKIKADTHGQANLRGLIAALQAETAVDSATKKPVPAHPELQGLKLDAKGQVDLTDVSNQNKIRGVLEAQDAALAEKVGATRDQFVVPVPVIGNVHFHALDGQHSREDALSDAGRDPVAAREAATASVQRKRVEISLAELGQAADAAKFTQIEGRTLSQMHDDILLARRQPGSKPPVEKVNVTTSRVTGRLVQDDAKQPLPPEMVAAFKAGPTHNLSWEVPLYKKDDRGKPVLDAKGHPVVGKIMRYDIVVIDGEKARPSGNQWDMTQAEQQSAFGPTWQTQRRLEAKDKVEQLHKQFLATAKAYAGNDPKVSSRDVLNKYQHYFDGLKELKANAKALGIDAKEVDAAMTGAGNEFKSVFDAKQKEAQTPPSIFSFKNLPAVAYVLKGTPDSALNGKLERAPDGFIKNFRDLNMSDPKNLKAFEDAIDRQMQKTRKTVEGGQSVVSRFMPWDDKFRKSEDAKVELQQLERARADLEKYKKELEDFRNNAAAPKQDQNASSGPGSASSSTGRSHSQARPVAPRV